MGLFFLVIEILKHSKVKKLAHGTDCVKCLDFQTQN